MKRVKLIFVTFLLFALLSSSTTSSNENQRLLKCIDKVVRLIEWNTDGDTENQNFTIGFIGDHSLYRLSNSFFRGKTYHDKSIIITSYHNEEEIENNPPKILFIGKNKHEDLENLADVCSDNHIFSISQTTSDSISAPLVSLNVLDDEVEIIVDKTEAEKQSFKLSYHLIRAAKVVK